MNIRHAAIADLPRMMEIYAYARDFMAKTGNAHQWGHNNWPPEALIRSDIESGKSYVCEHEGRIVGVFFFHYGTDIDPTYAVIENGSWIGDGNYGVVHRIAGDGSVKGIGTYCINWAYEQCGHLRIDTHPDNTVMRQLLLKLGFKECGYIHIAEDNDPRVAYEKI